MNATAEGSRKPNRLLRVLGGIVRVGALGIMVGAIAVLGLLFVYPPVRAYATPQSYVFGDTQTAVLAEWSEHASILDGTFQMAAVDPSANVIHVRTSAFGGTHDSARVTLDFRDEALGVAAVSGTLGWRTLQLDLPQPGGELASVRLNAGDLNDYNRAVQALKKAHPGFEIQGN